MKAEKGESWWFCSSCNEFSKDADLVRFLIHPETRLDPAEYDTRCPSCRMGINHLHDAYVCSVCTEVCAYEEYVHRTHMCMACEAVYAEENNRDPYPEGIENETRTPTRLIGSSKKPTSSLPSAK